MHFKSSQHHLPDLCIPNWIILLSLILLTFSCLKKQPTNSDTGNGSNNDTTAPTISLDKQYDGQTVNKTISLKANASDNQGMNGVTFYLENDDVGYIDSVTTRTPPYQWKLNTTKLVNSEFTLHAKALDQAGNEALSDTISFNSENYLFTQTFKNDWLNIKGYLMINDTTGKLIKEVPFSGQSDIKIEALKNDSEPGFTIAPDKIEVTLAWTPNPGNSPFIFIRTYMGIHAWTHWTWNSASYKGDLNLIFSDTTNYNHPGYVVANQNWSYSSSGNKITQLATFPLHEEPASIYIAYNISEQPYFQEIDNVNTGDGMNIPLSSGQSMTKHNIYLPNSPDHVYTSVYGSKYNPFKNGVKVFYNNEQNVSGSQAPLWYPGNNFATYRTSISCNYAGQNGGFSYNYKSFPDQFKKMDVHYNFISQSPDNFQIEITGDSIGEIYNEYSFLSSNSAFYWGIDGPGDRTKYKFPTLGNQFKNAFPEFDRESFKNYYMELYNYPQLSNGYYDFIKTNYEEEGNIYDTLDEYLMYYEYFFQSSSKQKQKYPSIELLNKKEITPYPKEIRGEHFK